MQILGHLGIYFDAVVQEVKTFLLLSRLALAIVCVVTDGKSQKQSIFPSSALVNKALYKVGLPKKFGS